MEPVKARRIALLVPLAMALIVGCSGAPSRPTVAAPTGRPPTGGGCDTAMEGPSALVELMRPPNAQRPALFLRNKTFSVKVPSGDFGPVTSSLRDVADLMQRPHPAVGGGLQYDFVTNGVGATMLTAREKRAGAAAVTWTAQIKVVCHSSDMVNY